MNAAFEARKRAEAEQFRCFAEFADQYRYVPDDGPVLSGTERLMQWGGDGTPGVAEFCTLEVAAALRMSEEKVRIEIGLALAVRHRLPHLWARVMAGGLRVWQACEVASATHKLSYYQALDLDEEIDVLVESMAFTRLLELVKARVMDTLREDADDEHTAQLARRRVEFGESCLGVTDMTAVVGAVDATVLDRQLTRLAILLRQGGSTESLDVRRAQALGLLANPARALQLLQAALTDQLPDLDLDQVCPAEGQPGHTCGTVTVDPDRLLPKAEVVVHISGSGLETGAGLVRTEGMGPLLAGWLKDLVGHTRVTVRPVLHPDNLVPTDAYECSHWMREWVQLRNPYEVFPFSKKTSRHADLDHTIEWEATPTWDSSRDQWIHQLAGNDGHGLDGGGGGDGSDAGGSGGDGRSHGRTGREPVPLTGPHNLGPLSRKVHRAKTFGGWQLTQPSPGTFLWRSPLGFGYLVTPSHTWMIEDPSGQILPKQHHPAPTALAS
ncbi:DUF222 domain-containing protein [Tessaracoccus sp. SD287]|uniref:DUF222 domain-containing protein n=1 Tax=Tessaracoccus sp. SD287 TaxID=2782008 RepID=UPI001A957133|nr:DUF222 domain-containing protein [Tessaracoccus sp. SD287]MBO1032084.1 DUF222 domain-containing protein [Tessaracoccus sp. SD287]